MGVNGFKEAESQDSKNDENKIENNIGRASEDLHEQSSKLRIKPMI